MVTHNVFVYVDYWDKLVDESNNNYHSSIGGKTVCAVYSDLPEEIGTNYKVGWSIKPKINQEKHLWLILSWTVILGQLKLIWEQILGSLYKKKLLMN